MPRSAVALFRLFALLVLPAAGAGLALAASLYLYLSPKLPSVETLKTVKFQTPLRIYSQDMKLIGEFGEKRRNPIQFEAIPLQFVQAVLAAEDDAFYQHIGVDFTGLLRASVELVSTGRIQSGGSTITMQLARNFFLTREQSFIRKFNEILLALRIEDEISKNEILTLYANKIYLGNRAYGVQAAALTYYGKSISDLDLSQLAMIAGLPKAPSTFNPIINPERALSRRNWILGRMLKLGYISAADYDHALQSPLTAEYHGPQIDYNAPYVAEEARAKAMAILGPDAYINGYSVITTVDSTLQQLADAALRKGLMAYDWRHGYRGPEVRIDNPEDWQNVLANTPVVGQLQPAIVTSVSPEGLSVLTKSLTTELIAAADTSLKNLRQYISENRRKPRVENFSDIFAPGDLVRLAYTEDGLPSLSQLPEAQAALVAVDPSTGAIRAMRGGFDFYQSHFNRVEQAQRQPGSNFKPFIYAAALESGMSPATVINDAPVVFDGDTIEKAWRPQNSSGEFYGPTRLREALYRSRNLVSIRILRQIGIDTALTTLNKFGFDDDSLPRDLSLALGSNATTPLKIAAGYASFANGGYKIEPYLVERIEDLNGEPVYQSTTPVVCPACLSRSTIDSKIGEQNHRTENFEANSAAAEQTNSPTPETARANSRPQAEQILDPQIVYLLDSMLKDVIIRGTGVRAKVLKRSDIAGKTGTTNGPRDAWFSGYNPDLVTTVWLGFDDNKLLGRREFGGSAALPIWIDFMGQALQGKKEKFLPQPEGLVSVKINPRTGLRSSAHDQHAIFELFREDNTPPFGISAPIPSSGGYSSGQGTPLPEDIF
ncbi:MAG TPA: peptidase [Porticoccaceae bacterium]|nr:peptidase [Porticoccaceae bacterium]